MGTCCYEDVSSHVLCLDSLSHPFSSQYVFILQGSHVCPNGSDCNVRTGLSSHSPKREGDKTHHIKVTSFAHNKRTVQAQCRRPLPQQSINTGDSAKRADSGCLCRTLPQNHHHDLTSVFGAVVPSKLKAGAMLLSCNAYCM